MSKTPRTDEQLKLEAFFDGIGIVETVEVEFAQQLETELEQAKAEIERLNKELSDIAPGVVKDGVKIFEQKKLIEQMREALRLALPEARSTHCEQTILAALAAERGE